MSLVKESVGLVIPILALGCSPAEDADADTAAPGAVWMDPGDWGIYDVGATTVEFTDWRGKDLTAELWYPAIVDPDDEPDPYPEIRLTGQAHRDEDPDPSGAPYPLLAFSHGFGGIRYQSAFLTEHLASHGYVTVAVDHPGNTFLDYDDDLTAQVAAERPDDVKSSVDMILSMVESDPDWSGMLQGETYAMMGHSFGGWTTLLVAGGIVDLDGMEQFCATDSSWGFCTYLDEIQDIDIDVEPDERAVLALPMAGPGWYVFGSAGQGLAGLAPALVMGGELDDLAPPETEIIPSYQAISGPKRLGILAGAGHYIFSDICQVASSWLDECQEEAAGYINIETGHQVIISVVTAWLGLEMKGDQRYADYLNADYLSRFPELEWQEDL